MSAPHTGHITAGMARAASRGVTTPVCHNGQWGCNQSSNCSKDELQDREHSLCCSSGRWMYIFTDFKWISGSNSVKLELENVHDCQMLGQPPICPLFTRKGYNQFLPSLHTSVVSCQTGVTPIHIKRLHGFRAAVWLRCDLLKHEH